MIVALALTACSVQSGGIVPDGLTGDTAVDSASDAGTPDDTSVLMDTIAPTDTSSPSDSAVPPDVPSDSGAPDTGSPDTGSPDTGTTLPSCDSTYGSTGEYLLCEETATTCEFYTRPSERSTCDEICEDGGGTCEGAYNETGSGGCTRGTVYTCERDSADTLCICSRAVSGD